VSSVLSLTGGASRLPTRGRLLTAPSTRSPSSRNRISISSLAHDNPAPWVGSAMADSPSSAPARQTLVAGLHDGHECHSHQTAHARGAAEGHLGTLDVIGSRPVPVTTE
jgi:hypothetical protein